MRPTTIAAATRLVAAVCLLLAAANARAERNSSARLAAFAKLPDWTGWWELDRTEPASAGSSTDDLPYSADWRARHEAQRAISTAAADGEPPLERAPRPCVWGLLRLLDEPLRFEATVTPEQTMFIYDVREYRHVWTDGRGHPPEGVRKASPMGHSIGHWEGETLLVDTVSLSDAVPIDDRAAMLSDQAEVTERWSMPDPDHLQVRMSIVDPRALTKPYQVTYAYHRVGAGQRLPPQGCPQRTRQAQAGDPKQNSSAGGGSDAN